MAWIIGWDLILEYTFGAVIVGNAWSGYLISILTKSFGVELGDLALRLTKGPWETVVLSNGSVVGGLCNLPGMLIVLLLGRVAYRGIKESTLFNTLMVVVKIAVILAFILTGWAVIDSSLWAVNEGVEGFFRLIPPEAMILKNGREVTAFGISGVITGTGVVFLSYIGFDIISTTAQECKNPSKDIPVGIIATLLICTVLYVLMSLVMTGVVSYQELGVSDPIAVGIDRIASLKGWSPIVQKGFTSLIKFGALAGLTSVILTFIVGQSRIFYAMGTDGLLPWFGSVHLKYSTPHKATAVTSLLIAIGSGFLPISIVGELVSIGTLLAFMIVCIGVPMLRIKRPDLHRPFRTPVYWLVGPLGAIACLWVMSNLPRDTWIRLVAWLLLGFIIYFKYGRKYSVLNIERNSNA